MNNIPELTSLVWIKYCLYSFADVYLLLNTKRVNDKRWIMPLTVTKESIRLQALRGSQRNRVEFSNLENFKRWNESSDLLINTDDLYFIKFHTQRFVYRSWPDLIDIVYLLAEFYDRYTLDTDVLWCLVKGGKKRPDVMQRSKVFMSVDSDKSASVSTAGAASNPESDTATQLDGSTKV